MVYGIYMVIVVIINGIYIYVINWKTLHGLLWLLMVCIYIYIV